MKSDALEALRCHPLFGALPAAELSAVLDEPAIVAFAVGEYLFRQGDDARRLYLIMRGQIDLLIERPTQQPEVLVRLMAGETVGADALLPAAVHAATALVVDGTVAAVIDAGRLIARLDADFDLALLMLAEMAGSLRGKIKEITELKLQSTSERLASYLAALAGADRGRTVVHLPCEKRLLADRLGMEPATLSRAFAKLRDLGVETGRGDRVDIADVTALRKMAESLDSDCEGGLS